MNKEGILKHKKVFDAWLEGAEIQYRVFSNGEWEDVFNPLWNSNTEYRVKPALTELEVGKLYELKETDLFCSTVSAGNVNKNELKSNLPYTYVGKIRLPDMKYTSLERYIFVSQLYGVLYYVMFATDNLDFVVSKLD
jgi:hypothetical protein